MYFLKDELSGIYVIQPVRQNAETIFTILYIIMGLKVDMSVYGRCFLSMYSGDKSVPMTNLAQNEILCIIQRGFIF